MNFPSLLPRLDECCFFLCIRHLQQPLDVAVFAVCMRYLLSFFFSKYSLILSSREEVKRSYSSLVMLFTSGRPLMNTLTPRGLYLTSISSTCITSCFQIRAFMPLLVELALQKQQEFFIFLPYVLRAVIEIFRGCFLRQTFDVQLIINVVKVERSGADYGGVLVSEFFYCMREGVEGSRKARLVRVVQAYRL